MKNLKKDLLEKSVEALKKLSTEMRDKMDTSTIQKLDEEISKLETCYKQEGFENNTDNLLSALSKVLKHLPDIEKIIQLLLD